MHPSELKNQALVAAAMVERESFNEAADAFKFLATACAAEARELLLSPLSAGRPRAANPTHDGFRSFEIIY